VDIHKNPTSDTILKKITAHHTFTTFSSKLQTFTTDSPFKVFQRKFCYVFLIRLLHS